MVDNLTLYYINGCPGARAVRLFLIHKKMSVTEKLVDFKNGDHRTTEFLKLNPMHTVPTLKIEHEDGRIEGMYESRVILKYLSDSYRNVQNIDIDKWLFWDLGFLNTNVGKIIYPRIFRGEEPLEKDIPNLVEKFEYLDSKLSDSEYLVGESMTIADLSVCMLVENSQVCDDIVNVNDYKNIVKWMSKIRNNFSKQDWEHVMGDFYGWRQSMREKFQKK